MHAIILIVVALGALVAGFVAGLCIIAKRADEAMTKAVEATKEFDMDEYVAEKRRPHNEN